jgi:predicted PurR-regulated permease PerM
MTGYQVFRNTLIIIITLALSYLFILSLNVWIVLVVAILIASALRPPIMQLRQLGIPQGVAILIVYGGVTFVTVTLLIAVLPPVINQVVSYIQNDNRLADRLIIAHYWVERFLSQSTGTEVQLGIEPEAIRIAVRDVMETVRVTAPSLIDDISNFAGDFILMIIIGIYWITSRERAAAFLIQLLPLGRQAQAQAILDEIEDGLGAYVRGIVLVSLMVGILCFVALTLLRIPNAATLSFVYGVSTAIPIIGGFVGVVLATGLAVLSSPSEALIVLAVTVVIQQIENYILTPRIMAKSADFDEILVIVFIAAGLTLNGITGALIAVPVAGTVAIILKHLVFEPRKAKVTPNKVEGGLLIAEEPISPPQEQGAAGGYK